MSNRFSSGPARQAAIALAVGLAGFAVPAAAQAAPVDLATVESFAVLGGSTVTNTGPSVLNGDLGVAPGTALVGFGSPAVVNGATHANDGVANDAQSDLTTAYNVAAGQPVPPANDLTGTNLGNRQLAPGSYRYASSAQLTGALTLNAHGDPNAQFVFLIGSSLTTAPASSVSLINGASPCNVFWQVGSSATLDTTTAFQGNLMALSDISLNDGASVTGRLLARNGAVTLINNVIDASACRAAAPPPTDPGTTPPPAGPGTTPPPTSPGTTETSPTPPGTTPGAPGGSQTGPATTRDGTARFSRNPRPRNPRLTGRPRASCVDGFRATVRGKLIARVVFSMDGKRIGSRFGSPFTVSVRAATAGRHVVRARVTFKDATRARTLRLPYKACAAAVLQPRRGPSQFAG